MKKTIALIGLMMCLFFGTTNCYAQTTAEIARGNCKNTADVAQKTLEYCNQKAGKFGEASVTNALKDCVNACKMTEDFLLRGSPLSAKSSVLCTEALNSCAKSCDKFPGDAKMTACANECRKSVGNLQKIK